MLALPTVKQARPGSNAISETVLVIERAISTPPLMPDDADRRVYDTFRAAVDFSFFLPARQLHPFLSTTIPFKPESAVAWVDLL